MANQHTDSCRKEFIKFFGKPIEEYDSVKRAVETLGKTTKQNYYRNLPNYFLFLAEDPDTVIQNRRKHLYSNNPELEEYYDRKTKVYIKQLKEKGMAGRGITGIVGRIQGFYSNNSKRYRLALGRLRISKARKRKKYSPSKDEVRELLGFADSARDRLIVVLMAHTGAAPVDLSKLCCGDLPAAPFTYFEKSRSKTGEVWRGVTTPDLVAELKAYIKVRGKSAPNDLLFKSREGYLDNDAVSRVVADLIKKAGYSEIVGFKPTSLRDFFEDALVDANIPKKAKEALMAHNSGIEMEYGGYQKMIDRLVEAMKTVYPLICLNDAFSKGIASAFSEEEEQRLKLMLEQYPDFMRVMEMVRDGRLVHVDDPNVKK